MPKPIAFRPSEKTDNAIALLIKQKKAKNKSDAVNQLIELAIDLEEKSQLEHKEREEKPTYPKVSYIPRSTPNNLKKELETFFRGQHSELIESILKNPEDMTAKDILRIVTCAR